MKKTLLLLAVSLAGTSCLPFAACANILVNGSFETGSFVNQGNDTDVLLPGSTAMTGWTVTGASGGLAWIGPTNPYGLTAADGNYFLDLTGYHEDPYNGVSTTISTVVGQKYDLSFALGSGQPYNSADPSIQVVLNGIPAASFTAATYLGNNNWQSFNMLFTATTVSTVLELDGAGAGGQNYIGLDNVNVSPVSAVPEPTTLISGALMLLPFGSSAFRQLRKKFQAA
jgi:hypothetical protein